MLAQKQVFLKFNYIILKTGVSLRVKSGDTFLSTPEPCLPNVALVISFKGNSQEYFFVGKQVGLFTLYPQCDVIFSFKHNF